MKRRNNRRFRAFQLGMCLWLFSVPGQSYGASPSGSSDKEADDSSLPAQDIVRKIRGAAKHSPEQRKLIQALRQRKISSPAELDALVVAAKDKELEGAALYALENMDSSVNEDVKKKAVALIDINDDTSELRLLRTVLRANVKNKFPGATQKIRQRLAREPKTKIKTGDDLKYGWKNNWEKGRRIGLIGRLAQALAESGDRESMENLFALDEVLATPGGPSILLSFGKDSLLYEVERYEREEGLRKEGCLAVVSMSRSDDSIPVLKKLTGHENRNLRYAALNALVLAKADGTESLLEGAAKTDSDEALRRFAQGELIRLNPSRHLEEIKTTLSGSDRKEQLRLLLLIARKPPQGSEGALENFIKDDEKANPDDPDLRAYAAAALWRLTGRKYEYSRGVASHRPYPWDDPTQR